MKICIFEKSLLFCVDRCLNQCTYCKTKHARGELGSYPPEEIVERARQSFQGISYSVYVEFISDDAIKTYFYNFIF